MKSCISRRQFLQYSAAGLAASCLPRQALAETAVVPGEFRRGGMVYRPLGKTGMNVSLLAFGSHTDRAYTIKGGIRNLLNAEGQVRRDRQISRAIDLGVNLIDVYEHMGQWEPLAKLVKPMRDRVFIAGAYDNPEFIGANIDRLARLYGGYIDLYRIRSETITFDSGSLIEQWDVVRRAKEAGKIRAIGIACHLQGPMLSALKELEGLEYMFLPYNFIHSKADYSEVLPAAAAQGVGLIGMKPLAAGSVTSLDPRYQSTSGPESKDFRLFNSADRAILPAAVAELSKALNQLPDETLCQAAMRYAYSRPFLSGVMTGMFDDKHVEDNYAALARFEEMSRGETAALDAARKVTLLAGTGWLPTEYQWLDEQWRA
ncbi:MAG: aldo/keto reductase [Opitutaceae bacterium]|jgi:aryl-alcohol dehydrogenase-like predicted oxidoreductase